MTSTKLLGEVRHIAMDNPLINLEKLSEPITKLIDVLSKGVGVLYTPFGTVRQAKADAAAKIIHAKADIEVRGVFERANSRVEYRESLRQENIEKIAVAASRELPKVVSEEPLNQDWILQFFDCAQDVCDEDIQILWGRILAGEVASPGSYAKRTLQFLRTLDKWEAEKFSQLCSLAFTDEDSSYFLVFDQQTYKEITEILGPGAFVDHFTSIGLLSTESRLPVVSVLRGRETFYFGKKYVFEGPPVVVAEIQKIQKLELFCELRYFSQIGQELAKIAGPQPVEGYVERLSQSLHKEIEVSLHEEQP